MIETLLSAARGLLPPQRLNSLFYLEMFTIVVLSFGMTHFQRGGCVLRSSSSKDKVETANQS